MAESENIIINIDIDGVENRIDKLSNELSNGFDSIKGELSEVQTQIGSVGEEIDCKGVDIVTTLCDCFGDVISEITKLRESLDKLIEQQGTQGAIDTTLKVWEVTGQFIKLIDQNKGAPNPTASSAPTSTTASPKQASPILLGLPEGRCGNSTDNDIGNNGFISSAMGDIGGLLSGGMSTDTMSAGMDTIIGKLQETTTAWTTQTAAKAADLAEDAKIVAMNTVEHVKSFGTMILQMAKATAAWVAETAAKIASTAAQWAQNAATTAWQAICVAATAVTTAFGAAVAFLTSPIGIVIVAITALIAIVVLLVENWDTVKATAIAVWEAIQSALGTAAEWFNTNVIQPVAEFFGGLWTDVCTFATDAWDGIVEVFSAVATWFDQNVVQPVAEFFSGLWDGICDTAQTEGQGTVLKDRGRFCVLVVKP